MARRRITRRSTAALALSAAVGMLGCGGNPVAQGARSAAATAAAEHAATLPVPKPIPGGDFFPDLPHHMAGIIHQFYPIDVSLLGDGPWAEPNEITDFDGLVAQVFQSGTAVDNAGTAYNVDVDTRVYVGEYVGTNGERAFGAFCTIWIDLYDPSWGSQLHDISPGNGENVTDPDPVFHLPGLFWLVRLSDDEWEQEDENTWKLHVERLLEFDRFQAFGPGNVPLHLDLETTYTRTPGAPTIITPTSTDPLSPNNWAGVAWPATASSRFSASYDDGSWSVSGTMAWAPSLHIEGTTVGHIIHERNGVFVRRPVQR